MFGQARHIRGIHPGLYLERELKKRAIPKGRFSLEIREYPQTLVAVTKGKRRMNPSLAMRIEKELGLEEGLMMTLQVLFDMEEEKRRLPSELRPNLAKFRPALFWDVDIQKLNWDQHRQFIIRRVMQRGNRAEQQEIFELYGDQTIRKLLSHKP